ncbi:MAG: hypothetical protein ABSA78_03175 [Candidatus Sulfotelmatobacter sp.]|jgi:hypothetical protein
MAITHAEHDKLKQFMAAEVKQFIKETMLEWAIAAEGAVADAHDPEDDDSDVYWLISLLGNLLWAATVFFPPAAVVAEGVSSASMSTKVASMLGATMAADVARKMWQDPPATDQAKESLRDMISAKEDELRTLFVKEADAWIASDLANYVTNEMLAAAHLTPDSGTLVDQNAEDLMKSVLEMANLEDYTLQHFLFPGGSITSGNVSTALRKLMLVELNRALADFNRQFRSWKKDRTIYVAQNGGFNAFGPVMKDGRVTTRAELLEEEYATKNPFTPHIRFHGVPPHIHGPQWLTMPMNRILQQAAS